MAGGYVKVEYNQAARMFPQIASRHPTLLASTLNRVATVAKRETINAVAKDLRLPRRVVANRLGRDGRIKEDRFRLTRASRFNLNVSLSVYARGLPVYQVAGHQLRRKGGGVKAKGGRFYQGAFKVASGRHAGMVFKRRGPERRPVFMPKIGVRQKLRKRGDEYIVEPRGQEIFRRMYYERLRIEMGKYGVVV